MECKIYAKADINPTEDRDKVIRAISNVIEYDELEVGEDYICAFGKKDTIKKFGDELRERKIRGVARKIMLKGSSINIINFKISKQAALAGTLNLVEDDLCPIGEINIEIKTNDVKKFIDWIAPEII